MDSGCWVAEMGEGSSFLGQDQAAGLRRWARQQGIDVTEEGVTRESSAQEESVCRKTLMVVGMPDTSTRQRYRVQQVLRDWHVAGQRWIGDPDVWRIVVLGADNPHLPILAEQQSRWALWVEGDLDGFRRAYRVLKCLAAGCGPRRLLAIHPGFVSRDGLLNNLQQAADEFCGIELLVLNGTAGERTESRR